MGNRGVRMKIASASICINEYREIKELQWDEVSLN